MKYKVTSYSVAEDEVDVEADSPQEASDKAENMEASQELYTQYLVVVRDLETGKEIVTFGEDEAEELYRIFGIA